MPRSRAARNIVITLISLVTAILLWDAGVTAYALVVAKKVAKTIPQSIALISSGNISGARTINARTKDTLAHSHRVMGRFFFPRQWARPLVRVPYVIDAAGSVAEALDHGMDLQVHISQIQEFLNQTTPLSDDGRNNRRNFQGIVFTSISDLGKLRDALAAADESFDHAGYLSRINKIQAVKNQVHEAVQGATDSLALYELGIRLAGFYTDSNDPQRYLILFQNNHELRPTGGFIGMLGAIELTQGSITNFSMADSYALDDRVPPKSRPRSPEPFKKYLGQPYWYFRDSNWSPDFPTAARQAQQFYKEEGGPGAFDGVIALTPEPVAAMLGIIGPITVDGTTFSKDNLADALEFQVERGFIGKNLPVNARKDIAVKLGVALVERLKNLSAQEIGRVAHVVKNSLDVRDIQLYSQYEPMQTYLGHVGWSGELQFPWKDYFMVVDANLGSLKTDPVIERSVDYSVTRDGTDGIATLTIHYKHTGTFTWKTTRYNSFTRLYVPSWAQLISSRGAEDRERSDDPGPVIAEQESFFSKPANKQTFGAYISIEPGKTHDLQFVYRLSGLFAPDRPDPSQYSLYVQKQAGMADYPLTATANLGEPLQVPVDATRHENKISWKRTVGRDQIFDLNLKP